MTGTLREQIALLGRLFVGVLGMLGASAGYAQVLDTSGFFPQPDSPAVTIVEQPDRKILVGGNFTKIGDVTRSRLARLNPDGTVDSNFANVVIDFQVNSIALQKDKRIVVAGSFGFVNSIRRNKIARLNPDGTLDTAFDPNVIGTVQAVVLQPDGKLIICGQFSTVGGQPRTNIARLNVDGSVDTAFNPNADGFVYTAALQTDGKIIIGGVFTHLGGQLRSFLARLNSDGTVDTAYNANPDSFVLALSVQKDGTAFVGGAFTHIGGRARSNLARLHADGGADANFIPDPNNLVFALLLLPDGKLVVGGSFTQVYGQPCEGIARFNADGILDPNFHTNVGTASALDAGDDGVFALAVQANDRLLIGGHFVSTGNYSLQNLIRMNVDGSIDGSYAFPDFRSAILASLAVMPDGKVGVGGEFQYEDASAWTDIVRFNGDGQADIDQTVSPFEPQGDSVINQIVALADDEVVVGGNSGFLWLSRNGAVDPAYAKPIIAGDILALAPQLDGKIVVGGSVSGGLLRVNADGTIDFPFFLTTDGNVTALAVQADGKIVLAGTFTMIGGQFRKNLARLNADGSLDTAYNPGVSSANNFPFLINSLALQADGKLLVGGMFDTISGQSRKNLARLNENGSLDASFRPNPDNAVRAISVQLDGRIMIGGVFKTIAPSVVRNSLARLNADGSLDDFNAHLESSMFATSVDAMALQGDGKLIVIGALPSSLTVGGITRFDADQPSLQSLDISATAAKWTRSGGGPELSLPAQLFMSTDGKTYDLLGSMQRTSGGWTYPNFTAPRDQNFYLRSRGRVGLGGLLETTRQFYLSSDRVFADGFE